jgi:hypothetical protein
MILYSCKTYDNALNLESRAGSLGAKPHSSKHQVQNAKSEMATRTDSSSDGEVRAINTPRLSVVLNEWRSRRAAANDQGRIEIRDQVAGGVSRENDSREDSATPSGPPVGIHGMANSPDLETPWFRRLVRDLASHQRSSRKEPLFSADPSMLASIGPTALPRNERVKFLLDLFYQYEYFSGAPLLDSKTVQQWWMNFLDCYCDDAEGWLELLQHARDSFESSTVIGARMRLHRVSLRSGFGCAVGQECPLCSPWTPKLGCRVLQLAANGAKVLHEDTSSVENLTRQLEAEQERQEQHLTMLKRIEAVRESNNLVRQELQHTQHELDLLTKGCTTFSRSFARFASTAVSNKRPHQHRAVDNV